VTAVKLHSSDLYLLTAEFNTAIRINFTLYLPYIQEGVGVAHVQTHTRVRLRGGGEHEGGGGRRKQMKGETGREEVEKA
jgi:hypothetical protein